MLFVCFDVKFCCKVAIFQQQRSFVKTIALLSLVKFRRIPKELFAATFGELCLIIPRIVLAVDRRSPPSGQ